MLVQDYYKSGRMLVKMAESMGRVALAGRELTRLAGWVCNIAIDVYIKYYNYWTNLKKHGRT